MLPDSTDKISKEITKNGKKLLELMPSYHSNDWFNDGWEDHTTTFSIILELILSFHGDSELNSAILTWQRRGPIAVDANKRRLSSSSAMLVLCG